MWMPINGAHRLMYHENVLLQQGTRPLHWFG